MSGVDRVIREVGERLRAEVPVGAGVTGLAGLPGVQGWYRDALEDFVRHADAEGRENESVGVFLIEPVSVVGARSGFGREVVWKARYLALENEVIALGLGARNFSVSPGQIEKVWKEAEGRQKAFFAPIEKNFGLQGLVGKRYNPLMGLGHSHPGGSTSLSVDDSMALAVWKDMQIALDGRSPGRITVSGHFVYSFGGLVDTLSMYDGEGQQTAQIRGNFVAAVQ